MKVTVDTLINGVSLLFSDLLQKKHAKTEQHYCKECKSFYTWTVGTYGNVCPNSHRHTGKK